MVILPSLCLKLTPSEILFKLPWWTAIISVWETSPVKKSSQASTLHILQGIKNLNFTWIFFQQICSWYHWASEGFRDKDNPCYHQNPGIFGIDAPVPPCRDCPSAAVQGLPLSFLCLSLRRAHDLTAAFGGTERKASHLFLSHWERINSLDGCRSSTAPPPKVSIIFLNCCKKQEWSKWGYQGSWWSWTKEKWKHWELLQRAVLQPVKIQAVARSFCISTC